jgi:hypothetical protein
LGEAGRRQTSEGEAKVSHTTLAAACQNTMTDTNKAKPRDMTFLSLHLRGHPCPRWRKDYSGAPRGDRKLMVRRPHFLFFDVV